MIADRHPKMRHFAQEMGNEAEQEPFPDLCSRLRREAETLKVQDTADLQRLMVLPPADVLRLLDRLGG